MSVDAYEVRQRSDKRGVNLISDALPFGRLLVWRTKRGQQRSLITRNSTAAHTML